VYVWSNLRNISHFIAHSSFCILLFLAIRVHVYSSFSTMSIFYKFRIILRRCWKCLIRGFERSNLLTNLFILPVSNQYSANSNNFMKWRCCLSSVFVLRIGKMSYFVYGCRHLIVSWHYARDFTIIVTSLCLWRSGNAWCRVDAHFLWIRVCHYWL